MASVSLTRQPSPPASKTTATTATTTTAITIYPAYCHSASPTYFSWVKLSAHDIHHALRSQKGFDHHHQGTTTTSTSSAWQQQQQQALLLFYLNHPIQFVYVVGVVVAFDSQFEKVWIFTVDDSSGATIEVVCRKPPPVVEEVPAATAAPQQQQDGGIKSSTTKGQMSTLQAASEPQKSTTTTTTTTTNKAPEPHISLLQNHLDVGLVVSVKGTINTFRNVRQIQLERLSIIPDTNAETRFWDQRTKLKADVLSKPWVVSASKQKKLLKAAQSEAVVEEGRATRLKEKAAERQKREARHAAKIARQYAREERERERMAEEAREDGRKSMMTMTGE